MRCCFAGVRQAEVELAPYPGPAVPAELDLFRWGRASTDPARDKAVQQAGSFAVDSAGDLPGAPVPVLRTARSLHGLARRGVVGEALATRRAARGAGLANAREAVRAARETAGKVVDRSVQLVLGASLAVFANARDLLSARSAGAVLLTISGLAGAALAVALRDEVPAGRAAMTSFREDADQCREALSQQDVDALQKLATLEKADADLDRARTTAICLHTAVAVAVLVGGAALRWNGASPTPPTSRPAATTTPSAAPSPPPACPDAGDRHAGARPRDGRGPLGHQPLAVDAEFVCSPSVPVVCLLCTTCGCRRRRRGATPAASRLTRRPPRRHRRLSAASGRPLL